MLTYKLSSGETLGVSSGKLWTRIVLFDTNGKQYYQDKYYTPIINLSTIRNFVNVVSDDTKLTDTIVSYISKSKEQ